MELTKPNGIQNEIFSVYLNKLTFETRRYSVSTIQETYSFSWRDIPKVALVILATFAICLLFPKHQVNPYNFDIGTTWKYADMTADWDFELSFQDNSVNPPIIKNTAYNKGDLIVSKGEVVTGQLAKAVEKNINVEDKSLLDQWIYFLGYFLLTILILGALILFTIKNYPELVATNSGVSFLLFWPVLFSLLVFLITTNSTLSPYLIPFCLVPIIVYNFWGGRLALFIHIVVVLLASFLSRIGYEFTFLQILAGIITVLIISETRYWNKFFLAILIIMGTYMLGYVGLALINSGSIVNSELQVLGWLAINSLLLLLAYPFIPIVEKIFGFTSSISLAELTDMNKPLIKELSLKAPGTLQHSLQVSNLSEAAAEKIGANSLLVKAAALYHDIGKMKDPHYFIENSDGSNPHDNLNNFESAQKIINHVIDGEVMAKKARVPKVIIDFIKTHHGTTRVEYFYRNQKSEEPDREFDESLFRYPGPKPSTKEQTILMLADSIEAASKSLKSPTGQDIDQLVDKIVDYKISEGQLEESALTFEELHLCTDVFKKLLRSIYHVRVEYPTGKSN